MFKSRRKLAAQLKEANRRIQRLEDLVFRLNFDRTKAAEALGYVRSRANVPTDFALPKDAADLLTEMYERGRK
jgi:hypothetical protein